MSIKKENKDIPVAAEADVVVIGSGVAGINASIAASRMGAKVVLIERFPFVGGMSTLVPISMWPIVTAIEIGELEMPYDGILAEVIERMKEQNAIDLRDGIMDGIESFDDKNLASGKWYIYDPEVLKYLFFEMLREAKVKLRVNSLVVDTIVENNKIDAIVVETLTRRELIKGRIFIDTTGSADVVARSGAPAVLGSGEGDGVPPGIIMPTSTTFRIAGVDTDNLNVDEVAQIYEKHRSEGEIKIPLEGLCMHIFCKGVVQIFGTRVYNINPLDPRKAARGEMRQRRQIRDMVDFFKRKIPAFRDCRLIDTGVSMGMIGTRRIRGDYFITQEDIIEGKKFDDVIATGTYRIEVWDPSSQKNYFRHLINTWYTIPYRSLLPKGLENVLVAGSCISGQYIAMASWAIMPVCFKTGQAAGTAAAMCIKENVIPREIVVARLQSQLRKDGIFLG